MTARIKEIQPTASSLVTTLPCLSPHTNCSLAARVMLCFFFLAAESHQLVPSNSINVQESSWTTSFTFSSRCWVNFRQDLFKKGLQIMSCIGSWSKKKFKATLVLKKKSYILTHNTYSRLLTDKAIHVSLWQKHCLCVNGVENESAKCSHDPHFIQWHLLQKYLLFVSLTKKSISSQSTTTYCSHSTFTDDWRDAHYMLTYMVQGQYELQNNEYKYLNLSGQAGLHHHVVWE